MLYRHAQCALLRGYAFHKERIPPSHSKRNRQRIIYSFFSLFFNSIQRIRLISQLNVYTKKPTRSSAKFSRGETLFYVIHRVYSCDEFEKLSFFFFVTNSAVPADNHRMRIIRFSQHYRRNCELFFLYIFIPFWKETYHYHRSPD